MFISIMDSKVTQFSNFYPQNSQYHYVVINFTQELSNFLTNSAFTGFPNFMVMLMGHASNELWRAFHKFNIQNFSKVWNVLLKSQSWHCLCMFVSIMGSKVTQFSHVYPQNSQYHYVVVSLMDSRIIKVTWLFFDKLNIPSFPKSHDNLTFSQSWKTIHMLIFLMLILLLLEQIQLELFITILAFQH